MKTTLAISDLQVPFEHQDTFEFLKAVRKQYRPNDIVCIGDEVDFHAISNFDADPDGYSAGHELERAIEHLKPFYKLFPDVRVCTSNHTARPFRKAFKHGIPKAFLKDYRDFLDAPKGWEWRDEWEVDGIMYEHGEGFSGPLGALKCAMGNSQSTVIGHLHSDAGILWNADPKKLIFGFNVGCLIDRHKYAFAYGRKMKRKPILGVGLIRNGVPTYVPMLLKMNGRWVGKL